jgi:hypothetical protein
MVKRRTRVRFAADRSKNAFEPLLDRRLAIDSLRRFRNRKKHCRVISETGNELLHIEVFERAQKLSSECFNRCPVLGLVRLSSIGQLAHRHQKRYCYDDGGFASHRRDSGQLQSLIRRFAVVPGLFLFHSRRTGDQPTFLLRGPDILSNRVCPRQGPESLQRAGRVLESTSLELPLLTISCATRRYRYRWRSAAQALRPWPRPAHQQSPGVVRPFRIVPTIR